jgi:hypothetical protein
MEIWIFTKDIIKDFSLQIYKEAYSLIKEGGEKLLVYDFKNVSNLRSPNYVRIYDFLDNMKNKLSESDFNNEVKKLRHCEMERLEIKIKNQSVTCWKSIVFKRPLSILAF